jgi:hypothetical protein
MTVVHPMSDNVREKDRPAIECWSPDIVDIMRLGEPLTGPIRHSIRAFFVLMSLRALRERLITVFSL